MRYKIIDEIIKICKTLVISYTILILTHLNFIKKSLIQKAWFK